MLTWSDFFSFGARARIFFFSGRVSNDFSPLAELEILNFQGTKFFSLLSGPEYLFLISIVRFFFLKRIVHVCYMVVLI